ncbi:MAG: NTP transferase domain-containing protein [Candidatus Heimdallarchaeota archaeon]
MIDAVILAAGYGSRLSTHINTLPKPLAPLHGTPLIEWVLNSLENMTYSIRHVVVVTGHRCKVLIAHLMAIQANYEFKIVPAISHQFWKGNGSSLCAAEKYIGKDPFLLLMGDHIVEPAIIKAALCSRNKAYADVALCTDRSPFFSNREHDRPTKVLLDDNSQMIDIGKRIPIWNCIDTGVFLMTRNIFNALHSLNMEKLTITEGVKHLIRTNYPVIGVDVSGMFWSDVDTYQDLIRTEEALQEAFWGGSQSSYREEEVVLGEE